MARPSTAAVRLLAGEHEPVRVATTADITLNSLQTIDGVAVEPGDRVLVKDQTDKRQNGIYTASVGAWPRSPDARTTRSMQKGMTVHVQQGTANASHVYAFISYQPEVGEDEIEFGFYLSDDVAGDINSAVDAALETISEAGDEAAQDARDQADRAEAAAQSVVSRAWFKTVPNLLADNNAVIGYAGSGAQFEVAVGDPVDAQGFRYEVAASGATDHHVENASGVKLYVLNRSPAVYLEAFDVDLDGPGDSSVGIAKAIGMLKQEGGGKLILPSGAQIRGLWDIDFGNADIDFNDSLLLAPAGADPFIVSAQGAISEIAYQISGPIAKGTRTLSCTASVTDIVAGDTIILQDDASRLADSATEINVELLRVAAVSGSDIHLAEPVNRSKVAWAGNIRRVDTLPNLTLTGGRTAGLPGATNNIGVFARRLGPGCAIDWKSHLSGVGPAVTLRQCWGVEASLRHAGVPQLIDGGQGYGLQIIQGSRFCDAYVFGEGQRHTLDLDSVWDCRARVKAIGERVSTVFTHNGAGGRITIDADIMDATSYAAIFGAVWANITGIGTSYDEDSAIEGLKVTATVQQTRHDPANPNVALLANQSLRDCDIEVSAVNGDGTSQDTTAGVSAAVRMNSTRNSGSVKVHSRGYKAGFLQIAAVQVETVQQSVRLDIDVDWYVYGIFSQYPDAVNIARMVAGANIDASGSIFSVTPGITGLLRGFTVDYLESSVSNLARYASIGANGIGAYTRGHLGTIKSPINTKAVSGNFEVTRNDYIAHGGEIVLALSGNSTLTSIEPGIFNGQRLVLQRGGSGTLTLNNIASVLSLKASPWTGNIIELMWINGLWYEV